MNIGSRISQRLKELGWERKDLLAKVPDLTPQALSNLIKRDSIRSEWDEAISDALGVSVMWLVYNRQETKTDARITQEAQEILAGLQCCDETSREVMRFLAKRAIERAGSAKKAASGPEGVASALELHAANAEAATPESISTLKKQLQRAGQTPGADHHEKQKRRSAGGKGA